MELIERYELVFDERAMPRPVTRAPQIEPWQAAIGNLLENRTAYESEAVRSRAAALRFTSRLTAGQMEAYLMDLRPREPEVTEPARVESLTPAQRTLLLERLRRRKQEGR